MKTFLIKKISLAVVLVNTWAINAGAQDIHFSQFYETSILRNPALTGIYNGDYRFGIMYRNQWNSINSAPFQTATASAEMKKQIGESQDFLGFGVLGFFDRTGSLNLTTLSGNVAVSYNKNLNEEHSTILSFGLMGGFLQRNYDPSKMIFGNQYSSATGYDPSIASGENLPNPKTSQMDIGAGLNYTSNTGADNKTNYSIGLAAYHLTRPESTFYGDLAGIKKDMRFNLNVSSNWLITEAWSAQALGNVMKQGKYHEVMIGGMVGRKNAASSSEDILRFYGGLMYRVGDAIAPVIKIDYNDLSFGMSYDMNVSKLRAASSMRGGFELSLIKTGLLSDPQRGFSSTVCPRR